LESILGLLKKFKIPSPGNVNTFHTEPVYLNVYGAQESIPRKCSLAGRYDNPIPPWFLAPVDSLKIPAQKNITEQSPYL
jgi:hypothetical protein